MDPYLLAMAGNAALTALAVGLIFDPFGLFDSSDDTTTADTIDETDEDQAVDLTADADFFTGGSGDDTVSGAGGDDQISGEAGDDLLFGGDDNDFLDGGSGNDTLEGNLGDDTVLGGAGDDLLAGGAGTDTLLGGAGNDVISTDRTDSEADFSRGGAETLSGGDGDDVLILSTGDSASGGAGTDQFDLVVTPGEDPATIEDFDSSAEVLTLFYDPSDYAEGGPELTLTVDPDNELTDVFLDGEQVLSLVGVQDLAAEDIDLQTEDALDFA